VRKKDLEDRIENTKGVMNAQNEKLKNLAETNKHFYRLTSPSPYMVA
jgi:hypothetical protein